MIEQIADLVRAHGALVYALLFAYCMLKSGLLPVAAGYGAQAGLLEWPMVAASVFLGGYLGDELRFALARRYGARLVAGRPRLGALLARATEMMKRHGAAYIFLYRYPKGARTIGALPVGLGAMAWLTFTGLNALSALVWTSLLVGAGYLLGASLGAPMASTIEQLWPVVTAALLAAFAFAAWRVWRDMGRVT
jgi:membrane protein DedA with SNARE-associated domain